MHKRSVECDGHLRSDGLQEVAARLIDMTSTTVTVARSGPANPFTTSLFASPSTTT